MLDRIVKEGGTVAGWQVKTGQIDIWNYYSPTLNSLVRRGELTVKRVAGGRKNTNYKVYLSITDAKRLQAAQLAAFAARLQGANEVPAQLAAEKAQDRLTNIVWKFVEKAVKHHTGWYTPHDQAKPPKQGLPTINVSRLLQQISTATLAVQKTRLRWWNIAHRKPLSRKALLAKYIAAKLKGDVSLAD